MTYEGGPRVCGYCAGNMHDQCDGSAWCEATQQGADCPCGHVAHHTVPLPDNEHLPAGYAEALARHEYRMFLPERCECVVMFAGTGNAERIPHQDCPIPPENHQDHRRQDPA